MWKNGREENRTSEIALFMKFLSLCVRCDFAAEEEEEKLKKGEDRRVN